jgi:hypothetical protein
MIRFRPSFVLAAFSASVHTSENAVRIIRRYENSLGCNTFGTSALLLSPDVKFVNIFRKETECHKGHSNGSPNLNKRLTHVDIITVSRKSVCILDSLMQHVSAQREAIMRQIRHKLMIM